MSIVLRDKDDKLESLEWWLETLIFVELLTIIPFYISSLIKVIMICFGLKLLSFVYPMYSPLSWLLAMGK